ncbi:hypothetical protein ACE6H2_006679 [Prunus campanulata]
MVFLILREEIIHVALFFSEFHFIHSFPNVLVQDGLPPEHGSKLFAHTSKHFLDGGRITDECGCHG